MLSFSHNSESECHESSTDFGKLAGLPLAVFKKNGVRLESD